MHKNIERNRQDKKSRLLLRPGWKSRMTGAVCMVLSALLLSACGGAELENKSFPLAVFASQKEDQCLVCYFSQNLSEVSDENAEADNMTSAEAAGSTYYEAQKTFEKNNRCQLDLSHTKALIFADGFLQDQPFTQFLDTVRRENIYARNTLVFLTDSSAGQMAELNSSLEVPLGSYLEQMTENEQDIKKQAAVTLGTILNEQANAGRTILLPVLKAENGMPQIHAYQVLQDFENKGRIDTKQAQIYYLLAGQLQQLDLHLKEGVQVRLSRITCRREFAEADRRIVQKLDLTADAESISGSVSRAETEQQLKDVIEEACTSLKQEQKIDLSDSRRQLAVKNAGLYRMYQGQAEAYCEKLDYDVRVRIHMTG